MINLIDFNYKILYNIEKSIIYYQVQQETSYQKKFIMIKSLQQINKALINLSQELNNKESSNETIKKYIYNLIQEVKFLDDKQKYHYYLLISQIYATRYQNIQQALNQLKTFDNTLDSQISMNCQLRIAFYKYFQSNYKQSFKHLDNALGQVQQELKLIDNARFFFNRVINKGYLITQSKNKSNFQAAFILSLIYQHQKQLTLSLKQIQYFLDKSNQPFKKFQIYKRFLQLFENMKKNSVSTISISKKSLQIYREQLNQIQSKYPQFQQNYQYKCKFCNRIIEFLKSQQSHNKQKLLKKLLDYKLLTYFKLKKCSKQAPSKDIKDILINTAKLIKASKQTQLLESILNYDFIKKQYEVFKTFYKPNLFKKLAYIKLFNALWNYSPGKFRKPVDSSPQKKQPIFPKKNKNISFQQDYPSPNIPSKYSQHIKPFSFQQNNSKNMLISQGSNKMKQTSKFVVKQTQSELVMPNNFQGSNMYKFNASSQGHQERYFYLNLQKVGEKPRLYYCISKKNKSSNDSYYSLKGLRKIQRGKNSQAFRRKQASKFDESRCFSLIFQNQKDRSFYVPNQDDLQSWIILLQTKVLFTEENKQKMTHTMGYHKKQQKTYDMNRSSPTTKKSRKINI